jgi:chromosome partitioning protein
MVGKLREVRGGRLRIALVASRLRERTRAAKHLEATLDRLTQAAKIRVRDSQVYVALAENGRSLFDDDGSVARPHREDWAPLLEWLEKLASAQTQGNVTPIVRAVPEAV